MTPDPHIDKWSPRRAFAVVGLLGALAWVLVAAVVTLLLWGANIAHGV